MLQEELCPVPCKGREMHGTTQTAAAKHGCHKEGSLCEEGGRQDFQEVRDLSAKS